MKLCSLVGGAASEGCGVLLPLGGCQASRGGSEDELYSLLEKVWGLGLRGFGPWEFSSWRLGTGP